MGPLSVLADPAPKPLLGSAKPRIAPPVPARSEVEKFRQSAKKAGIKLIPWQDTLGRYLYARGRETWLYPEVAAIVSRQQGKTKIIKPHALERMRRGRRVLHAAQTRELPRKMFFDLIPDIEAEFPKAWIRRATGQEAIELPNGGAYMISASTAGGPRGLTADDLICDEVRELEADFVQAALPTLSASLDPQVLWLSNAGSEESVVLNGIRLRKDDDPSLAYLEWSAAPERRPDDPEGWAEANPSLGHFPALFRFLETQFRSAKLSGTMAAFETEHLCRWVSTMREPLVDEFSWIACRVEEVGDPARDPVIGVSTDPAGSRASVVLAWRTEAGLCLRLVADARGEPFDLEAVGKVVETLSRKHGAPVGFDPLTDGGLSKFVPKGRAESISGAKFANASAQFVNAVNAGMLRWAPESQAISDDLTWTARKPDGEPGHFHAVRARDEHPISAALAAVRAVSLLIGPRPSPPRLM